MRLGFAFNITSLFITLRDFYFSVRNLINKKCYNILKSEETFYNIQLFKLIEFSGIKSDKNAMRKSNTHSIIYFFRMYFCLKNLGDLYLCVTKGLLPV